MDGDCPPMHQLRISFIKRSTVAMMMSVVIPFCENKIRIQATDSGFFLFRVFCSVK